MSKIHLLYIFVIGVLVALLCLSLNRSEKVEVVEKRVTDTLLVYKTDTLLEIIPKYIERHIVDTLYIPTNNQSYLPLPIESKHYSNDSTYDVWISGHKPNLDSIKTYPRIIERTITNSVEREVVINTFDLYPYLGFKRFHGEYLPSIGLLAKTKKNTIYGVEIGVDNNNDIFWGIQIGYKFK